MLCCVFQVENLLLTNGKRIKLCDLGSATTTQLSPDHSWSATQRGLAEDEVTMAIHYTHMYMCIIPIHCIR